MGALIGITAFLALHFTEPGAGLSRSGQDAAAVAVLMACFWTGSHLTALQGVHPIIIVISVCLLMTFISASCAFMLPAATPPNAIVFGSCMVRLPQVARTGIILNLVGAVVVTLLVCFLAGPALGVDFSKAVLK